MRHTSTRLADRHHGARGPHRFGPATRQRRAGAVMILVVLMLSFLLAMVAFTVDIGQMTMLRAEMQNGVDAGTLAAQLQLQTEPTNTEKAKKAAEDFIRLNRIGSSLVPKDAINVEIGVWDSTTETFLATGINPNAVHVFARQDGQAHTFGQVMGHQTFGAPASAIATGSNSSVDIMLTLDLSGSMLYQGRIEALRAAAPAFITVIQELGGSDQIGIMGLSADPNHFDPSKVGGGATLYNSGLHKNSTYHVGVLERRLTSDLPSLVPTLSGTSLRASKYQGWTGTGAALGDTAHYLATAAESRSGSRKIIVLMSDGHANRPPSDGPGYAREMAAYAASFGIKVYTISLGNSADEDLMEEIANATGGEHFPANGVGVDALTVTLTDAFVGIAGKIKSTHLVK